MKYPIPDAALDDRLGFIGTSGSGKTYNAGGAVEKLLKARSRVVIVDPLGVWWGLRLLADGKTASSFNVAIFGGAHGDLPLTENAGALIGETAATMAESCIVDLSELGSKSADRRFMTAFLDTIYRKAPGEPFHLVVDEADLFAPQKPPKGDETLLNLMEQIVRRGRVRGFIPWLISQRPAVLNKNVLSQVDGLIAFKLTASQDRDALDGWIEGQADKAQGKAIKDALPAMQVGNGVVWVPGRGVLQTAAFPLKETFDSSRTPKRGEKKTKTASLKPLDLGALKSRLASVETEAKSNDPKALKAEIARLKAEVAKGGDSKPAAPDRAYERTVEGARKEGFGEGYAQGWTDGDRGGFARGAGVALDQGFGAVRDALKAFVGIQFVPGKPPKLPPATRITPAAAPRAPVAISAPRAPRVDSGLPRPLQTIIDGIKWWNVLGVAEPTHAQAGFIAGYSHKSGTWATYLSQLRAQGLLEGRGNLVLTAAGDAAANSPDIPPTGEHLRAVILSKIDGPLRKILEPIIGAYPKGLSHAEVAGEAGYSHSSGTWATYLSKLRSLDLIEGRGELKAQDWMFP